MLLPIQLVFMRTGKLYVLLLKFLIILPEIFWIEAELNYYEIGSKSL